MRNTSRSASRSRSTFVSRTVRQHAALAGARRRSRRRPPPEPCPRRQPSAPAAARASRLETLRERFDSKPRQYDLRRHGLRNAVAHDGAGYCGTCGELCQQGPLPVGSIGCGRSRAFARRELLCKVWRRVFSDGATAALAASRQRKSPSTGSAARRTTACASDEPSAVGRSSCRQPSPARSPGRSIGRRGDLDPLRMDAGLRQLGQHSLQPLAPHEGDPAVVFAPQEGRPVVAHPRGELRIGGLYDRAVARDRDHGDPFGHRRRVVHRLLRFAAHLAAPCRDRMAVGCQRDVQHPDGAEDIGKRFILRPWV